MHPNYTRGLATARAVAILFLADCTGGEATKPADGGSNPPPPTETLLVKVSAPVSVIQDFVTFPLAQVTFQITASSTRGPVTVTCLVDNVAKPCNTANLSLPVGTHKIMVSGRSDVTLAVATDSVFTTVLPAMITGKLVVPTANGEHFPQGAYFIVGDHGAEDSVQVSSDGSISLNSRYAATSGACFIVRGDSNMGWLAGCVSNLHFGSLVIIGELKSFAIPSGDFAGQKIAIDMVKVTQSAPPPSNTSFFPLYNVMTGTTYPVGSWKSYPVCVALARTQSNDTITSADSVALWNNLDVIEKKFGMDLVKPCSEDEVKSEGGVSVSLRLGMGGDVGGISDGSYDDYSAGVIIMGDHQAFTDSFAVQHEFGHAFFGSGHTCAWDSIMRSSCPRYVPNAISPEDVAYDLLKIRTRELERKYNTRFSFAFSINWARLEQGLSVLKIVVVDGNGVPIP